MNTAYSITKKNQVTVPYNVRKILNLESASQIQYRVQNGRIYIEKAISIKEIQERNKKLLKNTTSATDHDIKKARDKFNKENLQW